MRVLLTGAPGAGKGTQGPRLADHLGGVHLSVGDIIREELRSSSRIGREVAGYVSEGTLVPDELTFELLLPRLAQAVNGFVLDGFPRNINQATTLDQHLGVRDSVIDVVVRLAVPEDQLVVRLLARGRADDQPDAIRTRLRIHAQHDALLAAHYGDRLADVDALGDKAEVFSKIQTALARMAV